MHILRCRERQLFILGLPCFLSLQAMLWDGQGWGSCPFSLQNSFLLGDVPVPGGMRDDLGKEDTAFVTRDGQDR